MKSQNELFENRSSEGDEMPVKPGEEEKDIALDRRVVSVIDEYIRRFDSINELIEVKGKLIEHIRKVQ
jgi:hypothetical protein